MNAKVDLHGVEVLVLEDDYYLADDMRRILEDSGAQVLGPFSEAVEAEGAAALRSPSCALVDINLGGGPSFSTAKALQAQGVPIIFVTGYDAEVIPADMRHVPCLQKPVELYKVLAAVRSASNAAVG
jgi:DNA-binding response OmpR family regulator